MCILPIHSTARTHLKKSIETYRQRRSKAPPEPHKDRSSNLRHTSQFFSQLVRQPHTCVYIPYIQTAIAHLKKSIEEYEQHRSKGLLEPHENQ